jgi:2-polyprenyl-3-methyl-5-hydroxy-6-metoxy-1,4-benzoquinol methylase
MSVHERIDGDWREHRGHVERYELAATLLTPGAHVLDAACGIGYGAQVLSELHEDHHYFGVDRFTVHSEFLTFGWFTSADLDHWTPHRTFDLGICLETLEHLRYPHRFASVLMSSCSTLLVSVPTIPSMHNNEHHLHDFTVDDVLDMFASARDITVIEQPTEHSHIFIIRT